MQSVSPKHRQVRLVAIRNRKMASSSQAFMRGSTSKFYEWLEEQSSRRIPRGPEIWICGDCHSGNLGPVADSSGRIEVQIRDLDQAVIGNPNHDLIRLAFSLASAARGSGLPGVATAQLLENMMEGYGQGLQAGPERVKIHTERPECVKVVMKRALRSTWNHMARLRLEDAQPTIPLGKCFWPLSCIEKHELIALFKRKAVKQLVTCLKGRETDSNIEVLDAAFWVKGCSSLGRLRYAVMVGVRNKHGKRGDYCLIDIKEAVAAAAPRSEGGKMPRNNGRRVVEGARHVAPALGGRMEAAQFLRKSVFMRELLPQDLKIEIGRISEKEAARAATFLASVLGKAHGRQMDSWTRKGFCRDLKRHASKRLNAPSWLWSSVIELAGSYEVAYLEHCRQYAVKA